MTLRKLLPYSIACLLTALPILSSCVDGGMADVSLPHEEADGSGVYVSVVVNTDGGARTRAIGSPTPGENGDGPQAGVGDENRVYDVNVFFFEGKVDESTGERKGINSTGAENIAVSCIYFDKLTPDPSGTITRYSTPTQEVKGLYIGKAYDVLVIANDGKDMSTTTISTLAELRDYTLHAISGDTGSGAMHFLMSSAGPEINTIEITPSNSRYNPSVVVVDVERMAARIDVHLKDNNIYTPDYAEDDQVKITGMTIVNAYHNGSHVFKRVADATFANITYLGDETIDANGVANNYVIDPETLYPGRLWRAVTVLCPDSGLADGLSTALFLLPQAEGQALLDKFGCEALWVDSENHLHYSPGFRDYIRT